MGPWSRGRSRDRKQPASPELTLSELERSSSPTRVRPPSPASPKSALYGDGTQQFVAQRTNGALFKLTCPPPETRGKPGKTAEEAPCRPEKVVIPPENKFLGGGEAYDEWMSALLDGASTASGLSSPYTADGMGSPLMECPEGPGPRWNEFSIYRRWNVRKGRGRDLDAPLLCDGSFMAAADDWSNAFADCFANLQAP